LKSSNRFLGFWPVQPETSATHSTMQGTGLGSYGKSGVIYLQAFLYFLNISSLFASDFRQHVFGHHFDKSSKVKTRSLKNIVLFTPI
jgi:hypothetical protein